MERERTAEGFEKLMGDVKAFVVELSRDIDGTITFQEPEGEWPGQKGVCYLTRRIGERNISMRVFSTEDIYKEWADGKDEKNILEGVRQELLRSEGVEQKKFFHMLPNYEVVRSHLIIRPINYDRNRQKLENGLCHVIGDVALTLYFDIGMVEEYYASSMVPSAMLKVWKKDWNDVFRDALANTASLRPIDCTPFGADILLSTQPHYNGSIAIFLPGMAKEMGKRLDGDYYIVFTSIHEIVLHNSRAVTEEEIHKAFQDMEEAYPLGEEYLTDQVFFYSRKRDLIIPLTDHK